MAKQYLSLADFANRVGIARNTIGVYSTRGKLPEPDAIIGIEGSSVRGWLPETVDAWQASRPGKGGRPPKSSQQQA